MFWAMEIGGFSPGNAVALRVARLELRKLAEFGSTENRARSCGSVSRIKVVISRVRNIAFVNIFGGGKLSSGLAWLEFLLGATHERSEIALDESEICSR